MEERTARQGANAVAAAIVGNTLEWYDFVIYLYLAAIIARNFFPSADETAGLLATYATFGTGFVARPLGAIVLGWMGDRFGRKLTLVVTMTLMAAGTLMIGVLPAFQSAGLAAPVLLVLARLVQGFSVGGEWGNSAAFIVEWAPEGRRGFLSSLQQCSVVAGLLLGSGITAFLSTVLDPAAMENWGWRLPFIVGAFIGPVGVYIRSRIGETPAYDRATKQRASVPLDNASRVEPLLQAFGIMIVSAAQFYIFLGYLPTHMEKYAGLGSAQALWSTTLALGLVMVAVPFFGLLSDRIGRKPLLMASCMAFVILPYLVFANLQAGATFSNVLLWQLIVALGIALYSGALPSALSELFTTRTRTTDLSIANAAAVTIFGGFAPYIATWLITQTGSPLSPAAYVIACAIASGIAVFSIRETAHLKLR